MKLCYGLHTLISSVINHMDLNDIATYGSSRLNAAHNFTSICTTVDRIYSRGVFFNTNPLHFSVPLLLFQCAITSGVILLTSLLLKPLGAPLVISQIVGGIILGPSGLGRNASFINVVFPLRSFILIDVLSSLAFMFYFFLLGVQMDPWILKKIDTKTSAIGCSAVVLPMALTTASYFFFVNFPGADPMLLESLPVITQAESVLAFPVVAYILSELKIINSDFGRIALSASTVSALPSVGIMLLTILSHQTLGDNLKMLSVISTGVAIAVVIVFAIRPAVLWMISNHPEGEPIKENHMIVLFLAVLVAGFSSRVAGLHTYFGPLVLGMAIPADPPLGSAILQKLDFVSAWILMPLYFLTNGFVVDIFKVRFNSYIIVQSITLIGAIGKFLGTFLSSLYCQIPVKDAVALGLLLNAQGILELGMFKMLKRNKAITPEAFIIMSLSLVIVTGVVTPLVRFLYDPSRKYTVYQRRTVMQSRPNSELRVLVCIHDQDNVPAAITLLEALNPTKQNPLEVHLLRLIEHVGSARPRLIYHMLTPETEDFSRPTSSSSVPIINAFANYENANHGAVTVHPFTAISPCNLMHDDVCSIAIKKGTSLIIIPFYRTLLPNGATESYKKAARILNGNVLNNAPCSVAILNDRGLLRSSGHDLESRSSFRVAVLFLGGPDDREALAIAERMAGRANINLTMIRLVENGYLNSGDVNERRLDNEVVGEFRLKMIGNLQVLYIEEVVIDGSGTVSVIRSLEQNYELVIVGRCHDKKSELLSGLLHWSEQSELGAIGELLTSEDFASNATILVVQQHINFVKERKAIDIQKKLAQLYIVQGAEDCRL